MFLDPSAKTKTRKVNIRYFIHLTYTLTLKTYWGNRRGDSNTFIQLKTFFCLFYFKRRSVARKYTPLVRLLIYIYVFLCQPP